MKILQWLVKAVLVLAGVTFLVQPIDGQAVVAKPFVPTRFTVVDEGTVGKPDVVLLPGLTSSREVWAEEAKRLAPNYRLHLVQVNGFDGAPAGPNVTGEILPGIVEELHLYCAGLQTTPVLIGHSLGGLLTLMLADKYPADVRKMVIVDTLPFLGMTFGPDATPGSLKPQAERLREIIEHQTTEQRTAGAERTADKLALNPEAHTLLARNSEDSDAHVVAEATFEDLQTDLRAQLASIKAPTLMLYPFDPTLTRAGETPNPEMIDELYQGAYKSMPGATAVRVDGSRHFIMLDQPEKFDAMVEEFLK
jgi:pimeloyl-ACP methyl ester carboxylesterase